VAFAAVDLHRKGLNRQAWLVESVRSQLFNWLFSAGVQTPSTGARSYLKGFDRLKAIAMREPADWFIAHTQSTLPIAAMAAERWQAKLGFDCEDLLAEMDTDPGVIVNLLQRHYLPLCNYVSVPSQCLGTSLGEDYTLPHLVVLYNVFPLCFAEAILPPHQRPPNSTVRLHWFGQTIGAGRGVEEAIDALGMIATEPFELHLRGLLSPDFRSRLEALSQRNKIEKKIFFHDPISPQLLIKSMDQFDVGPRVGASASRQLFAGCD
jgi:hypothetical protein